jgi:hypothetical protein
MLLTPGSDLLFPCLSGRLKCKHDLTQGLKIVHQINRLQLQRAEYLCQDLWPDTT